MYTDNRKTKTEFPRALGVFLVAAIALLIINACSPKHGSAGTESGSGQSGSFTFLPKVIDTPTAGVAPAMDEAARREFHSDPYVPESSDPALAGLEKKWGIRIVGVTTASAGYMLYFRFKVMDPQLAAPLLVRGVKPYLEDEATGARFAVPVTAKVGPLRQETRKPTPNRIYYSFFANPGKQVKSGDSVTVVIGEFKAEHLIVQ